MVTIILPTLAEPNRKELIMRAVRSIRESSLERIQILVIVNGARFDPSVCTWLRQQPDIRVEQISQGSLPLAIFHGRKLVETEYFGFLDDDDEYLRGSTDRKLEALRGCPSSDLAISNGFRARKDEKEKFHPAISEVVGDPLKSLFRRNWLASCGGIFRSSTVRAELFTDLHPYAEWTWLAFQVSMHNLKILTLDEPGFVIYDTPGSLSKSADFRSSYFGLYRRMLLENPPKAVSGIIREKIGAAWHDCSVDALAKGQRFNAINYHVRSLFSRGGLRYLSYTRRLFPGWEDDSEYAN